MFSPRHYKWLAAELMKAAAQSLILNKSLEHRQGIRYVAHFLCDSLAAEEPNFKPALFLKACGIDGFEP